MYREDLRSLHYNSFMRNELIHQIQTYHPYNQQEQQDKEVILQALMTDEHVFLRSDVKAHMTASAWVVNQSFDQILMAYHNLYDSWSWLGGHADGEEDLLSVSVREVKEESGACHVEPLSTDIFSLEVLTVDGHEKNGSYISSHLHLNITYLLMADDHEDLICKPDENRAVSWFPIETAVSKSSEPWFRERIYSKLNDKLIRLIPDLKQKKNMEERV